MLELPCPANGVLTQILKRDGSIVVAGEVIALVDTEATASAESKPVQPQTREMELFASAPAAEPGGSGDIGSGSRRSAHKTGKGRRRGNRCVRQ